MKPLPRHRARTVPEALVWYHFLPVHSARGEYWYHRFRSLGAERIAFDLDSLVARMRCSRDCLEAVSRDLDTVRDSIVATLGLAMPASIHGVLEEAYRGALAYLRFRQGFLESADSELEAALQAVRDTLRSEEVLLTFSLKNLQLITNRARVAKTQRDWPKMNGFLDVCRRMIEDHAPLHSYGTTTIYFRDICSFYQSIEPTDAVEAEALDILAKPGSLARGFQQAIDSVVDSLLVANDF